MTVDAAEVLLCDIALEAAGALHRLPLGVHRHLLLLLGLAQLQRS